MKLKTLASSALEGVPGNVENRENTNIFSHSYCLLNLQNILSCFRIMNAGAEEKKNVKLVLKRIATFVLHC